MACSQALPATVMTTPLFRQVGRQPAQPETGLALGSHAGQPQGRRGASARAPTEVCMWSRPQAAGLGRTMEQETRGLLSPTAWALRTPPSPRVSHGNPGPSNQWAAKDAQAVGKSHFPPWNRNHRTPPRKQKAGRNQSPPHKTKARCWGWCHGILG